MAYAPKAIVYNRGPRDTAEFLVHAADLRRAGAHALRYKYLTSSLRVRHLLPLAVEAIRSYPYSFCGRRSMAVEKFGARVWEPPMRCVAMKTSSGARPTPRRRSPAAEALTLISVKWAPGSLNARAFLKDLRRHSESTGSVFWWTSAKADSAVRGGDPLSNGSNTDQD